MMLPLLLVPERRRMPPIAPPVEHQARKVDVTPLRWNVPLWTENPFELVLMLRLLATVKVGTATGVTVDAAFENS
jgi:hypothetical protein